MARTRAKNRLRAPLMYAFRAAAEAGDAKKQLDLRTEEGERVIASRRAAATQRRSLSDWELRRLMNEDLESLLNTTCLESSDEQLIDGLENVKNSILNFGIPELTSRTIDETGRIDMIRHELRDAIQRYEPRILLSTLQIERDKANEGQLSIRFVVNAEMRADPVPASVEFVTEVELASGDIRIENR
ncbi:MAG: type VI secretion system baseplate subunit TssE [Pseudomonadota bacterium]